jgi:hypothetical protein
LILYFLGSLLQATAAWFELRSPNSSLSPLARALGFVNGLAIFVAVGWGFFVFPFWFPPLVFVGAGLFAGAPIAFLKDRAAPDVVVLLCGSVGLTLTFMSLLMAG